MLKALLKKQFLELGAFYLRNRRSGKLRSASSAVPFLLLYAFVFFSVAASFYGTASLLGKMLVPAGFDWLYFSLCGLLAVFLGTVGSVFTTYTGLYLSKDNELLLSMPIPPSRIVIVRLIGVYASGFLYCALAWLPAAVWYLTNAAPSPVSIIFLFLLLFLLPLFVLVLSCIFGWLLALITSRLKGGRSILAVILALIFLAVYYVAYSRINALLSSVLLYADRLSESLRTWAYPVYLLGRAAAGDGFAMLAFAALAAALCAVAALVLIRSFVGIATMNRGSRPSSVKAKASRVSGMEAALLRKELRRFTASAAYMLNCGLGLVILLAGAVYALVKGEAVRGLADVLTAGSPLSADSLPALAAAVVCMICSTCTMSAASVSLEGKSLWVLQSLPVPPQQALRAKERLHTLLCSVPAALCSLIFGCLLGADALSLLLMLACVLLFVRLMAAAGLTLNLLRPNLSWTNEIIPIKQGLPVGVSLFSGMLLSAAIAAGAYLTARLMDGRLWLAVCCLVLLGAVLALRRWTERRGAEIFDAL